jgi:hypothetical protein
MKTTVMWTMALAGVVDGSVAQAKNTWTALPENPSVQVQYIINDGENVLPVAIDNNSVPRFASTGGVSWFSDALPANGKTPRVAAWITEDANFGTWVATSPDSPNGPEIFYQSAQHVDGPWTQIFGASVYPIVVANPNTNTCGTGLSNATMFGVGVDGNVYYSAHSVTAGACNDAWHYIGDLPNETSGRSGLPPGGNDSASGIALFNEQGHTSICSPNNYLLVASGSSTGYLYKYDEFVQFEHGNEFISCVWWYTNGELESGYYQQPSALANGYVIGGGNDVYQYTLSSNSWSLYTSATLPSNNPVAGISFASGKLYGWDEPGTPYLYTP